MQHPDTVDDECYLHWGSGLEGGVEERTGELRVPVFAALPSGDRATEAADIVVARLVAAGRDVTVRHYIGCDHGFFDASETGDGKPTAGCDRRPDCLG